MTELLRKAFDEASKLPQDRQDAIASLLLAELESDRQWDTPFSRSQQALARLADEAVAENERGETEELDPSSPPCASVSITVPARGGMKMPGSGFGSAPTPTTTSS